MHADVMMDLETWGTEPGCDIRSIGACVFDPLTGRVAGHDYPQQGGHTFYIATDNPRGFWGWGNRNGRFNRTDLPTDRLKYPLERDPRTVQWWSEQSEAAQAAFADPVDLKVALERFAEWLITLTGEPSEPLTTIRLWSHGAATDIPWLAAAYKACKLPVPWHYRAPRDTRTIFDAAGIDDHSAWLAQTPGPLGVPHHALDDAICQARAVCGAYARIGSVSDDQFDEIGNAMVNLSALLHRDGFFHNSHNHEAYERVVSLWQNAIGHPNGKELRS